MEHRAKYGPTPAEVAAVRMAAGGEFRLYLEILIETGARPSEGLALTWADIGPDWLVLYTKKTATGDRMPGRMPMAPSQGRGKVFLFQQADKDAPHHYIWPRKQHLAACALAGVRPYSVGCYRHHHAVELYRQTRDLLAVQERLGHADAKTTQHYLRSLLAR